MSTEPSLSGMAMQLKRHWEQYLPKMTAQMKREGTLHQHLTETANHMLDQEAALIQGGMSPDMARESVREIGFLPEEDDELEDDDAG